MSKALAFFPWIHLDEALDIEHIRLIPWEKNRTPDKLPHANLGDIDAVLGAYAERPNQPISQAVLLEASGWQLGQDPSNIINDLFYARTVVGFSALSLRRLFSGGFDYCSFDSYTLVVQKYQDKSAGSFAFTTRRRDGGANQMWSSDEYAFHRPHHVAFNTRASLSQRLVSALLARDELPDSLVRAITEFNLANTDSPDLPEHIEIVMMKSAFEWLFQINQNASEFARQLKLVFNELEEPNIDPTPASEEWFRKRPKAERLIECWAREFCDLRGVAAHGRDRSKSERFVWPEFWHLAFCAILFPLLVKRQLRKLGLLEADAYDLERLRHIELYLATDPVRTEEEDKYARHPWSEVDTKSLEQLRIRQISALMDSSGWE